MARRKDAEEDRPSRIVLDQLNTKTVGAPPSSTGLTGDQLPDTIFSVDDFSLVRNQVTLQLQNLELLNVLNTIGQITNMQSQSGPIPKTGQIVRIDLTSSSPTSGTVFEPGPGEVWQITGASTGAVNATRVELNLRDPNGELVEIGAETAGATQFDPDGWNPVFLDENIALSYFISGLTGDVNFKVGLIRVR